jgi:DNA-binding transcriptional MerR regulator
VNTRSPYLATPDVAEAVGVSLRTLNYWMARELVEVPVRDPNNRRRYKWTTTHVNQIANQIRSGDLPLRRDSRRKPRELRMAS